MDNGNLCVAVVIEANHTCVSARGVQNESTMMTSELTGAFKQNPATRQEFYEFINRLPK